MPRFPTPIKCMTRRRDNLKAKHPELHTVGPLINNHLHLFHGIGGFNPQIIDSILNFGIAPYKSQVKIASSGWGTNGDSYISTVCSPRVEKSAAQGLKVWAQPFISFVIDSTKLQEGSIFKKDNDHEEMFYERQVKGSIPITALKGILIPQSELDKPFFKLKMGINKCALNALIKKVKYLVEFLNDSSTTPLSNVEISSIYSEAEKAYNQADTHCNLEKVMEPLSEKLANLVKQVYGESFTLRDYLKEIQLKRPTLLFYDSNGYELTL